MIYVIAAVIAVLAVIGIIARFAQLEHDLRAVERCLDDHDDRICTLNGWQVSANFRFADDEKDIAKLKSQCERYKGYIYRTTGEDTDAPASQM